MCCMTPKEKHGLKDVVKNIGKLSLAGLFVVSTLLYAQSFAQGPETPIAAPAQAFQAESQLQITL